jgi:methylenetetrahydrofolate dehydrogenase (NADP+) / methenyltetrahydrofolate cyclohydrolase
MIINGKNIAERILEDLAQRMKPAEFFAGIVVGTDPAAMSFQKLKQKTAERLGLDYRIYEFSESLSEDELRKEILKIADQSSCGGVVIQLPLPPHVNKQNVLNAIPREKDPDVLSERSLTAFQAGKNPVTHPAVAVVEEILREADFDLKGKDVSVVGAGFLIGRPIAAWLMDKAAHVSVLDKGSDLSDIRSADLVILGAGQAGLVTGDHIKEGAGVIDFGYSDNGKGGLAGDLDVRGAEKAAFYTPTPGGTGPILVACLFRNFFILNTK